MRRTFRIAGFLAVFLVSLGMGIQVWAAEVPKELQVPQEWIEGAKREGKVVVYATDTPEQASQIHRVFNQRYPFIALDYTKAATAVRYEKVLFAAKQGKAITDLVTAISGVTAGYVDSGVLMDLSNLPVWSSYPKEDKLQGKYLSGPFTRYWGVAYNTNLVSKNDVPATWDELLTPKWKGKVAANSITKTVSFFPLWYAWGPERATTFLERLVANGLQNRKEGHDASLKLLYAGEYSLLITAGDYQVYEDQQKGAPAEWVALDPVPAVSAGLVGALKDAAHPNALRIYVNWLMSEEGQRIYSRITSALPVHPKLADLSPSFKDMARRMAGKRKAVLTPEQDYQASSPGGSPASEAWNRVVLKGL